MIEQGISLVRCRFVAGDPADFPIFVTSRDEGMTDVVALITRFAAPGVIGEMDCVYSYWSTDRPHGFEDAQVEALTGLMPTLALAIKCVSLARIAGTLVETYLGRDAGRRVLGGLDSPRRRRADQRRAVVQRPARVHPDHRPRAAARDHPAAQRLRRNGDLRGDRATAATF